MKSSDDPDLPIGELAARFGLATHVLRHWEDAGLLLPARDPAGRRRYGADEVVRVAAIIANQAAGLSLEQIRTLFDVEATGRRELLEQHLAELERRRVEIEVAREVTEHALHCTAHDVTTCPRFREAVGALVEGRPVPAGQHPGEWRVTAHDRPAGGASGLTGSLAVSLTGGGARPPRSTS